MKKYIWFEVSVKCQSYFAIYAEIRYDICMFCEKTDILLSSVEGPKLFYLRPAHGRHDMSWSWFIWMWQCGSRSQCRRRFPISSVCGRHGEINSIMLEASCLFHNFKHHESLAIFEVAMSHGLYLRRIAIIMAVHTTHLCLTGYIYWLALSLSLQLLIGQWEFEDWIGGYRCDLQEIESHPYGSWNEFKVIWKSSMIFCF